MNRVSILYRFWTHGLHPTHDPYQPKPGPLCMGAGYSGKPQGSPCHSLHGKMHAYKPFQSEALFSCDWPHFEALSIWGLIQFLQPAVFESVSKPFNLQVFTSPLTIDISPDFTHGHKVGVTRNQHPYVMNYVSTKRRKIFQFQVFFFFLRVSRRIFAPEGSKSYFKCVKTMNPVFFMGIWELKMSSRC
jgi:hypothetical protein